jgi:hypothetical protein
MDLREVLVRMWTKWISSGWGSLVSFYEHGHEYTDFIKAWNLLQDYY